MITGSSAVVHFNPVRGFSARAAPSTNLGCFQVLPFPGSSHLGRGNPRRDRWRSATGARESFVLGARCIGCPTLRNGARISHHVVCPRQARNPLEEHRYYLLPGQGFRSNRRKRRQRTGRRHDHGSDLCRGNRL